MPVSEKQVIIIGAGVAGLACARELEGLGVAPLILEKSDRVGGRVQTDEFEGFLLDRGFQVLLSGYTKTLELSGPLQAGEFKSGALIWDGTRLNRLFDPLRHPSELLASLSSGVFSPRDYLSLLKLIFLNESTSGGSTLERLAQLGFSQRSIQRFFRPFFGGVFLDETLETPDSFFEFSLNHFRSGRALLPRGGMRVLPESIAAQLKHSGILFESPVQEIREGRVFLENGRALPADAVVIATEQAEASRLVGETWRSDRIARTCYFAAPESPLNEPVILLNGSGAGIINSLSVLTDVEAGYSANSEALISVSLLQEGTADETLEELEKMLGEQVLTWRTLRSYTIERALPMMTKDHRRGEGVFLCGDYFTVPSIENAVRSGIETAQRVGETLGLSSSEACDNGNSVVPERSPTE